VVATSAAALDGRITVLLSEPILGEVLGVPGRRFSRDTEVLARIALFVSEFAERLTPASRLHILADEPDNRILECAVAGRSDLIVTEDRTILGLRKCDGILMVALRDFLVRLQQDD
jgi:predicted nucleic acid-binding protein